MLTLGLQSLLPPLPGLSLVSPERATQDAQDESSLASSSAKQVLGCQFAAQENIVIPEEVTSTFGESQSFPVSEAASGIEHAQRGGNLEGWTLGLLRPQGRLPNEARDVS